MAVFQIPRIMIAAPASGSGKTMVSCGLLAILKEKQQAAAFKCGPDYIDPMFHRTILGTPSRNLDSWLADAQTLRGCLARGAMQADAQICLIEGVMGYYDGLGGNSTKGSSYEVSTITQTPVILVVDAAGAGLSLAALIKGFQDYRSNQQIQGVILNRCSQKQYMALREEIENTLHIAALGYIPRLKEIHFPGRHLGLMLPEEIRDLQERISSFAEELKKTVDIERILEIAGAAPAIEVPDQTVKAAGTDSGLAGSVRIGIAQDEAFCFYYEDNLDLLRRLGAELVPFSPMHDRELPEDLDGIYMGGGYPELHAKELSENRSMLAAVAEAAASGIPCLAECGAYMYLHKQMEDAEGKAWPMAGVIPGKAYRCGRLVRFGYCQLEAEEETILGPAGTILRAHEFHYWDSENAEGAFTAWKPGRPESWKCMYRKGNLLAGFPHLYFPGAPEAASSFVETCRRRQALQRPSETGKS